MYKPRRLNLTVSEGLEVVVSCGMAVPRELITTSKRMDEAAQAMDSPGGKPITSLMHAGAGGGGGGGSHHY